VKSSYDMRFTFLSQAVSRVALFGLTSLIQLPEPLRELSLRLLATGGLGYVVILFHRLFMVSPYLPLLPAMLIALVLYVMFLNGNSRLSLAMTHPIQEDETTPEEKEDEDGHDEEKKNNEVSVSPPLLDPCASIDQTQSRTLDESALEGFLLAGRMASQIKEDPLLSQSEIDFSPLSRDSFSSDLHIFSLQQGIDDYFFRDDPFDRPIWEASPNGDNESDFLNPMSDSGNSVSRNSSDEEREERRLAEAVKSYWDSD
jgi:hypothetical protein